MDVDVLIIGQGLSGSFLSLEAKRLGLSFRVIDDANPSAASRVASGLINPVTGKRAVRTWMDKELIPFARAAYNGPFITETRLLSFFSTPESRTLFLQRMEEDPTYLRGSAPTLPGTDGAACFHDLFGFGVIEPCYRIDLKGFLSSVRADLLLEGALIEDAFSEADLAMSSGGIRYQDLSAGRIIFCDGASSAARKWFDILPFSLSKGEALILEIPALSSEAAYKRNVHLVPLGDGRFWAGSSYDWNYSDLLPTEAFRLRTEQALKDWLKVPFRVLDYLVAVRPTTVEQKPFVGFHPVHSSIGILGGMGTKGCSLAPYFARQLIENICFGTEILPEADVRRFTRLLSR